MPLLQMLGVLLLFVFDHLFVYYTSIRNIEFSLWRKNIQINVQLSSIFGEVVHFAHIFSRIGVFVYRLGPFWVACVLKKAGLAVFPPSGT